MTSFRNALFLFVVVVGGVNSATFQRRDYKHRSSVWSAKKTSPLDMFSLWKNHHESDGNGVKGCCLPALMTSTWYERTTDEIGNKSQQISFDKTVIYRDQANRRFASDYTEDGVTDSQIVICTESGTTWYEFWRATKVCNKGKRSWCLVEPDRMCFPPNGTLVGGSFHLGAGPDALAGAQLWRYTSVDRQAVDVTEVVLTPDNCVPVAVTHEFRSKDEKFTREVVFTDVTLSFDPSVFTPPSYCNPEEED